MSKIKIKKKEIFSEKYNLNLKDTITLNFTLKKCQNDFYYKIVIINEDSSLGNFDQFETEEKLCDKDDSEINFEKKLNCDYIFNKRQLLIISVLKGIDINSSKMYIKSERITILSSLIASPDSTYERCIRENETDSEIIRIKLDKDNLKQLSIFNFIKSGIKLSCSISIDFAIGQNDKNLLLEENNDDFPNIIKKILDIISIYTSNNLFNVYGIGGKIKSEDSFKGVFNISMNDNESSIKTYDKIIDNYNECKSKIISDYNIFISPLLNKINNEIYELNEYKNYNILFILIKQDIYPDDIKNTLDAIIESSYLPLSIIIINASGNDLGKMDHIFNSIPNKTSVGTEKKRDNVLFTSLYNCDGDIEKMFEICFKEIIKQMLFFYDSIECTPEHIQKNNYESIKNSFNLYHSNIISQNLSYFLPSINDMQDKEEEKANDNDNDNENQKNETNLNISESENIFNSNYNKINNYNKNIDKIKEEEEEDQKYISPKPALYIINDNNNINNNYQLLNNDNEQKDNNINNNNNVRIIPQTSIINSNINNNNNYYNNNYYNNNCNDNKIKENKNIKKNPKTSVYTLFNSNNNYNNINIKDNEQRDNKINQIISQNLVFSSNINNNNGNGDNNNNNVSEHKDNNNIQLNPQTSLISIFNIKTNNNNNNNNNIENKNIENNENKITPQGSIFGQNINNNNNSISNFNIFNSNINNNNNNNNEQKENNNINYIPQGSIFNSNININNNADESKQNNNNNNYKLIPQTSVFDGNMNNPYSQMQKNEPENNNIVNRNYNRTNTTINENKNNILGNPYAEDYKKRLSGIMQKSNFSDGMVKKNNKSNTSAFSTSNSENSKESKIS